MKSVKIVERSTKMSITSYSLNKLFTNRTFNLVLQGKTDIFNDISSDYLKNINGQKNLEVISNIYSFMSKNYRNEYYYKNTLLNKLLLGVHSVKTTTALTELPVSNSIADFVMINGHAAVYEIKTDLDNFERLLKQVEDYYKAFNRVFVVTHEKAYQAVLEMVEGTDIGIYLLSKKGALLLKKNATEYNESLNHAEIFKILRKKEFENIIKKTFGALPTVDRIAYYDACRTLIQKMPILELYSAFIKELKLRNKVTKKDLDQVPQELKTVVYFANYTQNEIMRIAKFLDYTNGG